MRILILGGSGMLGHKMWQGLSANNPDTYVTLRKLKSYYDRFGLFNNNRVVDNLDLSNFEELYGILNKLHPEVIINCAGVTPRSKEGNDKIASININALLPHHLLLWCQKNNSRLIHFSTVCVFDGVQGGYTEESVPNAQDLYGRTKILGELFCEPALTLRSSFIGRELSGKTELLEWVLSQQGNKINGYRHAIFTGITTNYMVDIVHNLIQNFPKLCGLYHIASEKLSKYELLLLIKEAFGLNIEIVPNDDYICKRDIIDKKIQRAIGYHCPSWEDLIRDSLIQEEKNK